jgi:hypothetical protein
MQIERKTDEKGKEIFCVGKFIFYSFEEAVKKLHELKELKKEEDKKKKAEKTDLMKEVARLPKKDDKKNKTEVKGRS